eukprot:TRINITY_DN3333_c0_g1_i2.p1 TRINITY_DN3333_c0_g1~~TRINITY_DN3333_c0_g1_i2.p1  ORF type:complete len:844 (+),score=219.62 TRINITY_DN3333_c0_g1_i2:76-2607(+)
MAACWRLTLLFSALLLVAAQVPEPDPQYDYVDEDQKVSDDAKVAIGKFCDASSEDMTDELRTERREQVTNAAGGDDLFYNILLAAAKNETDAGEAMGEELSGSKAFSRAMPLFIAMCLIPIYCICCWTAWPCCKGCRAGSGREKENPMFLKGGCCVVVLAVAILIIVFSLSAMGGHRSGMDGLYTTSCTSAKLLDTTLFGEVSETIENPFIGFKPLLNEVADLRSNLDTGSAFITEVSGLLDQTKEITDALAISSGRLKLLRSVMNEADNKKPSGNSFHDCLLCNTLPQILDPAVDALDNSLGKSLAAAREQVDVQLQGDTRVELQSQLDQAVTPVKDAKKLVRDSFKFAVSEAYEGFIGLMDGPVRLLVVLITFIALGIALVALVSASCWVVREKASDAGADVNPYYKAVHRAACCSWCCGFCMVFLALLIGGIIVTLVFFLANMCVLIDGMTGPKLQEVMGGISGGVTMDSSHGIIAILDQCILTPSDTPVNVLDLVKVDAGNATSAVQITFREKFDADVKQKIDEKFSDVASKGGGANASVANNPAFQTLLNILSNPLDAMYTVDFTALMQDAQYSAMNNNNDLMTMAPNVGLNCADTTLTSDVPAPLGGKTVNGIDSFKDLMVSNGATVDLRWTFAGLSCAYVVTCTNPLDTTCQAGKAYLDLKTTVKAKTYKCGTFESPTGSACDASGANAYSCLHTAGDGTRYLKEKINDCTFAQYVAHVADFKTKIEADLARVDSTASSVNVKIGQDMKASVSLYLLKPIEVMVERVTCNFMHTALVGFKDGMCFQGVPGLRMIGYSYVACGVLGLILILVVYVIWRRTIDNVNAWDKKKLEGTGV